MISTIFVTDFMKSYYWIFIIICIVILIALVILIVVSKQHMIKAVKKIELEKMANITDFFGGKENLVSHHLNGSRLTIVLKDYSKIDKEKLKEIGVERFVLMSDKCILVGKDLMKIEQSLNNL